ncbi:MAG: hypothetical protein ACF8QF_11995 [Phycisphaerales bacterium]
MPRAACAATVALYTLLAGCAAHAQMTLRADATDIDRSLVRATLEVPAQPGDLDLRYVEWLPGNHNPSGPIWNVVDFFVFDDDGDALEWDRDPRDPFRITVRVPEKTARIRAEYTYIANQPWVNSRSTDTYGRPGYGGMNWNSVTFYPGEADRDDLQVDATLVLPDGWSIATDLPVVSESGGAFTFETASLAQFVDSPVIFGAPGQIRTITLPVEGSDGVFYFHGAAPRAEHLELPESRQQEIARVIEQAHKVFGPYPHDEYHFLILLGDDFPGFGVEHHTSTFIDMSTSEWMNADQPGASTMGVVPHEYVHVWSGKLRSPEGLHGRAFHDDGDAGLLWVYEGLASYYDSVISVRGGLSKADDYRHSLLRRLIGYDQQTGRSWRSVEDTARGQRHLRARYELWSDRIRRQDYYSEGALFWMLADATIRRGTDGEKSLDDWAIAFHSVPFDDWGSPVTYTRADIVESLGAVYPGADWDALIAKYIESPGSTITSDLPPLLGWRIAHAAEPTDKQERDERRANHAGLFALTLGLGVSREGEVRRVLAGSPADAARIAYGMQVLAVGDAAYSADALRDAIEASPETGAVTLLVEWGDRVYPIEIRYDGGLRYPRFEAIEGETDLIEHILEPR